MKHTVELHTEIRRSARVLQTGSMFDVPLEQRLVHRLEADLPLDEQDWNVGLVVGPSGAGKSTLVREVWPAESAAAHTWSGDRALVDDFPAAMGVRDVVALLNAVGLGSPPAWLRPHRTLSNGEAFRADMARRLAETDGLVVVDEFTSVVDRQVAKVASHAVQKTVRRAGRKLVAATCHYDVLDWLQPDWVFDAATAQFAWRSVQPRPRLELRIHPVDRAAWRTFSRHHYLSAGLHAAAKCYGGWIGGDLVAFSAYVHFPHPRARNIKRDHRTVVLPDYQGLGISGRMVEWIGQTLAAQGFRYRRVIAHPAVIAYCERSPRWREANPTERRLSRGLRSGPAGDLSKAPGIDPRRLNVRSFEYAPTAEGD